VGGAFLPQSCGPSTQEMWEDRLSVRTEAMIHWFWASNLYKRPSLRHWHYYYTTWL